MKSFTLRISVELEQALLRASAQQGLSKSAIARRALQQALCPQLEAQRSATAWVTRWRGSLKAAGDRKLDAERLIRLHTKHLR